MAWDDVLAAVGGVAQGVVENDRTAEKNQLALERMQQQDRIATLRAQVQTMVAQMNEGGRNSRFTEGEAGKNSRNEATITGQNARTATTDATVRRGQDMTDDRYWSGENPISWDREFLTRRGQDVSTSNNQRNNATSRANNAASVGATTRGQDIGAETTRRGQDMGGDSRALGYALDAYDSELKRRKQNQGNALLGDPGDDAPDFKSWLDTSDDPEIFPSVRRMFSGGDGARGSGAAAPAPPVEAAPTPNAAPSGGAAALEGQARALMSKIRAAQAAGRDTTQMKSQLRSLREQAR